MNIISDNQYVNGMQMLKYVYHHDRIKTLKRAKKYHKGPKRDRKGQVLKYYARPALGHSGEAKEIIKI